MRCAAFTQIGRFSTPTRCMWLDCGFSLVQSLFFSNNGWQDGWDSPYTTVQEPPPFYRQSLPCVSTGAMRAFARIDLASVDRPIDHSLSRLPIACVSAGPETNNQHRPF
ncbi:uncharacterized protein LY79DRAFT_289192 [Colletotrichum navitas]|uniref:Uncharacterized protein n=1 Tax=Colletotrichum navitas TaxID=681940 RepID=A0AAD8V2E9_9PEZI|nr:uncharacterized protein LY79DRAFT_289192 [Colletotrichum navitas]KAK1584827.1 hypothetical protein LY79DRAFT_289192 [Colletotrichum navitas]